MDAIVLQIACPRPIRFMVFKPIYEQPLLNPLWAYLVAGEQPGAAIWAGGAFILSGIACRYWPARRPAAEPQR